MYASMHQKIYYFALKNFALLWKRVVLPCKSRSLSNKGFCSKPYLKNSEITCIEQAFLFSNTVTDLCRSTIYIKKGTDQR